MIGANSSPLSMFNGAIDSSGPSMYQIGYAGGPGGGINAALNATIDRYHSVLDAQNEQTNKLAQIKATGIADHPGMYDAQGNPLTPGSDPDAKGPITQYDPVTKKSYLKSTTINPTTGQSKIAWSPVSINAPEPVINQVKDKMLQPMLDQLNSQNDTTTPPVGPGMITQGDQGAVADTTGQQGKVLDAATAAAFVKQAGGDNNKARMLAQQAGYTI